jgi:hypothetical protein
MKGRGTDGCIETPRRQSVLPARGAHLGIHPREPTSVRTQRPLADAQDDGIVINGDAARPRETLKDPEAERPRSGAEIEHARGSADAGFEHIQDYVEASLPIRK